MSRELDAEIAEKIIGFLAWRNADGSGPPMFAVEVQHYSTDIAAAWQVVEKVRERTGRGISLVYRIAPNCADAPWVASFYLLDAQRWDLEAEADTAPLAICRAALKAVSR